MNTNTGHWEAVVTIRLPGPAFKGHGEVIEYVHGMMTQEHAVKVCYVEDE